jgi:fatty acid desaturase
MSENDGKELFDDMKDLGDEYPPEMLKTRRMLFRADAKRRSRMRRPGCLTLLILGCIIALVLYALFNWDEMTAWLFVSYLTNG